MWIGCFNSWLFCEVDLIIKYLILSNLFFLYILCINHNSILRLIYNIGNNTTSISSKPYEWSINKILVYTWYIRIWLNVGPNLRLHQTYWSVNHLQIMLKKWFLTKTFYFFCLIFRVRITFFCIDLISARLADFWRGIKA